MIFSSPGVREAFKACLTRFAATVYATTSLGMNPSDWNGGHFHLLALARPRSLLVCVYRENLSDPQIIGAAVV
jgi:hypothetical protein